jgi:hypothetical protein
LFIMLLIFNFCCLLINFVWLSSPVLLRSERWLILPPLIVHASIIKEEDAAT